MCSGAQLGTIVGLPLSYVIVANKRPPGDAYTAWPFVFYWFGLAALAWYAAWCVLVASTPAQHAWISVREAAHIEATRDGGGGGKDGDGGGGKAGAGGNAIGGEKGGRPRPRPPWRALLTEPAMWAIYTMHFSSDWAFYVLLTGLPSYLNEPLGFNVHNSRNAVYAVLPYLAMFVCSNVGGRVADRLIARWAAAPGEQQQHGAEASLHAPEIEPLLPVAVAEADSRADADDARQRSRQARAVVRVRRLFGALASLLPALGLVLTGYTTTVHAAIVGMTLAVGVSGVRYSSYSSSVIDVAPVHADCAYSISNTFAAVPGVVGTLLSGLVISHAANQERAWRTIFWVAAAVYVAGCASYSWLVEGAPVPAVNRTAAYDDDE